MKANDFKLILAAAFGALGAYLGQIVIPLLVMAGVMVLDYITGMTKAWVHGKLSSKIGLLGIVKKVFSLFLVAVAMVADYILLSGISKAGLEWRFEFFLSLLVIVWLIVNECISILENLAEIGVPVPDWLVKLMHKLKNHTEQQTGDNETKE